VALAAAAFSHCDNVTATAIVAVTCIVESL
jgi:hypothetical protein